MAFELVDELRLLVSYQTTAHPTDAEWDAYLATVRILESRPEDHRTLAVTEGGHPSGSQQARLRACVGKRATRVALISSSVSLRFVASAIALVIPNIRCFSPAQRSAAFAHLGLRPSDWVIVEARVAELREQLERVSNSAA
jgi:hypothetical protein